MKNVEIKALLLFLFSFISISVGLRNPFLPLTEPDVHIDESGICFDEEVDNKHNKKEAIVIKAIVKSNGKTGAILTKGFDRQLVFIDDNAWGYKVAQINDEEVSLKGENGTRILLS